MRELHLRHNETLSAPGSFRAEWLDDCVRITARPPHPYTHIDTMEFFVKRYGRDVPHDRTIPNLSRIGEFEWRIEGSVWPVLPSGTPIVLTGWDGR